MLPIRKPLNMKKRDINGHEINRIVKETRSTREKAFFTLISQSGLAPHTIKKLRIQDVERILEPYPPTPCKIKKETDKTPPTFIANEAVQYLKRYLQDRAHKEHLTPDSLLFTTRDNPNKEINTKDISRTFKRTAQKLQKQRTITYEVKQGKPSQLRLYSLVNFYKTNAKQYLKELSNTPKGKDDEFYRRLYKEKAMPNLQIEPPTQTQIQHLTERLDNKDTEVNTLKETITTLQPLVEFMKTFDDYENLRKILDFFKMDVLDDYEGLPEKLRPNKSEFSPYIGLKLQEIAKTMGISEKEALKRLFADDVEAMKKAEERWKEIEERLKLKRRRTKPLKPTKKDS